MKKLMTFIVLLTMCGCGKRMSNEDIVAKTNYCHEQGLGATRVYGGLDLTATDVQCDPSVRYKP